MPVLAGASFAECGSCVLYVAAFTSCRRMHNQFTLEASTTVLSCFTTARASRLMLQVFRHLFYMAAHLRLNMQCERVCRAQ